MKKETVCSIMLWLLVFILSACGAGGGGGTPGTTSGGSDTTPPGISNQQPSGPQPAGTTSVTMSVTTNENATCKYSTTDIAYGSMANTFTSTGSTAHSTVISGLSNGNSYTRYVRCRDTRGNTNASSAVVSWSVGTSTDIAPPVISNPLPSGVQPAGTTQVTMQVTTNENATCRYSTTNVAYGSMSNTFTTTGSTAHSNLIPGLSDGNSYTRYVRCQDAALNANTSSTIITWSVASPATGSATLSWTAPTTDVNGGALTELTGYKVYYCSSASPCNNYNTTPIATVAHPTLTYTATGLASGYHCYDIKAYNSGGDSPSACGSGNYCCKQIP